MHLLETYAVNSGSLIGRPYIYQKFFPLPFEKFVTIHTGTGMESKNYDFFQEVVNLLQEILQAHEYRIIQLGDKQESPLEGTINFCGKTNIHQTAYILERSACHISGDTCTMHMAGHLGVPQVALFGATNPKITGPYWWKEGLCHLLVPVYKDKKPSYMSKEFPKSINNIKPEDVANRILQNLLLEERIRIETLYIGPRYNNSIIEIVPDTLIDPRAINGLANIRLDLLFNEELALKQISISKSIVMTDRPLNVEALARLKQNVVMVIYDLKDSPSIEFVKELKKSGLKFALISDKTGEELNALKFMFFDFGGVNQKPSQTKEALDNHDKIGDNTYYKTKRLLLSNGKVFSSSEHWKRNEPVESARNPVAKVIDSPEFWKESDTYLIFNRLT